MGNQTFENARATLNGRATKKTHNNTYARFENGSVIFRLHSTDIVTVREDGAITLDSGGWHTATTKDRMNDILHSINGGWENVWRVSQDKGAWYVSRGSAGTFVFADGITLDGDSVTGAGDAKDSERIAKQIKKYVTGYVAALFNGEISAPGGGDCWYCLMRTTEGQSLGDATNSDHIFSHFDEGYYVPSLLYNAVEDRGGSDFTRDGIARLWDGQTLSAWQSGLVRRDVTSILTRYLKLRCGIAA